MDTLILGMGFATMGAPIGIASEVSTDAPELRNEQTRDAIANAQTVRERAATRPEQKITEHDLSNKFDPTTALPSSPIFGDQPDKGKVLGFDFARDPLNAKKPTQTFEETLQADVADRKGVMKTQQKLLNSRYDLKPRLDPEAKMSRGKPLAVGPTARLKDGISWGKLATMAPSEIRSKNIFPYPSLPHPKQSTGGQVFLKFKRSCSPVLRDLTLNLIYRKLFCPNFPLLCFFKIGLSLGMYLVGR